MDVFRITAWVVGLSFVIMVQLDNTENESALITFAAVLVTLWLFVDLGELIYDLITNHMGW